jgi:hypothetical protein
MEWHQVPIKDLHKVLAPCIYVKHIYDSLFIEYNLDRIEAIINESKNSVDLRFYIDKV